MIRSQKLLLKPNNKQAGMFARSAGLSRFAWNWALALSQRYYRMFKKGLSSFTLAKHWNKVKHRRYQWATEFYNRIPRASFNALGEAMKATFKRLKKGNKAGFPKFHKRGRNDGFQVLESGSDPALKIESNKVKLPLIGWIRFSGEVRWLDAKQLVARVKEKAGRWWLSITFEVPTPDPLPDNRPTCGIDLGCKTFATVASGGSIEAVPALKSYAKTKQKLQRLGRIVSRRFRKGKPQSNRYRKAKLLLSRVHERVANQRNNFLHQTTSRLTKTYGTIVLEDLNVAAMGRGFISGTIQDMGFSEFRRQVEYKSEATGTKVIFADRFFPSSKTCCECGLVRDSLSLTERTLWCPCGCIIDRDENAARNLEKLGRGSPKVTHGESGSSLPSRKTKQGAARRTVNAHSVSITE